MEVRQKEAHVELVSARTELNSNPRILKTEEKRTIVNIKYPRDLYVAISG